MPKFDPPVDLIPDFANKPGFVYDAAKKTKWFAEYCLAIYGRQVAGLYTSNPRNLYIGQAGSEMEVVTEDQRLWCRELTIEGVFPVFQIIDPSTGFAGLVANERGDVQMNPINSATPLSPAVLTLGEYGDASGLDPHQSSEVRWQGRTFVAIPRPHNEKIEGIMFASGNSEKLVTRVDIEGVPGFQMTYDTVGDLRSASYTESNGVFRVDGSGIHGPLTDIVGDRLRSDTIEAYSAGFVALASAISMGGFAITDLLDPVAPQDAATRNYVDNAVGSGFVQLRPTITGIPQVGNFEIDGQGDVETLRAGVSRTGAGGIHVVSQATGSDGFFVDYEGNVFVYSQLDATAVTDISLEPREVSGPTDPYDSGRLIFHGSYWDGFPFPGARRKATLSIQQLGASSEFRASRAGVSNGAMVLDHNGSLSLDGALMATAAVSGDSLAVTNLAECDTFTAGTSATVGLGPIYVQTLVGSVSVLDTGASISALLDVNSGDARLYLQSVAGIGTFTQGIVNLEGSTGRQSQLVPGSLTCQDTPSGAFASMGVGVSDPFVAINDPILGQTTWLGYRESAADPSVVEFPAPRDFGFHFNTTSSRLFLAMNFGGVVKKVELT